MKKYFILGVVSFSLLATTVYAFNGNGRNNPINQTTTYHQNCPYHTNNETCPYHTDNSNCQNCAANTNNNTYRYGTGGHHGRHNSYTYHH